jgi:hypothetical protein
MENHDVREVYEIAYMMGRDTSVFRGADVLINNAGQGCGARVQVHGDMPPADTSEYAS